MFAGGYPVHERMKLSTTSRGKELLLDPGGYEYILHSTCVNGKMVWKCRWGHKQCKARVHTVAQDIVYHSYHRHNHEPPVQEIELKERLIKSLPTSPTSQVEYSLLDGPVVQIQKWCLFQFRPWGTSEHVFFQDQS